MWIVRASGSFLFAQVALLINRRIGCPRLDHKTDQGTIMAKRKKASKVQKRAKLRRGNSAKRGKPRSKAKAAKRAVAKAKPKRAPVKNAGRKVKAPVAPVVETVAVEVIEQPAPGVITVTEVGETRQVS